MNLKQSLASGIEIIENAEVVKRYRFNASSSTEDTSEDIQEALNMCDNEELEPVYRDTSVTYDVSYQGQTVLFDCYISELEDFINRLVIKDKVRTMKVSQKQLFNYKKIKEDRKHWIRVRVSGHDRRRGEREAERFRTSKSRVAGARK